MSVELKKQAVPGGWVAKIIGADGGNWGDWRWQMGRRLKSADDLARLNTALGERLAACRDLLEEHPLLVTPYYLSLADPEDPSDPILAQCLPSPAEVSSCLVGEDDPLDEEGQSPLPGMIKRYPDRALLMVTGECFLHCRHCNRRRYWKKPACAASGKALEDILDHLRRHDELREVIISGGDPLTLSNEKLDSILTALRSIRHLEVIRIGTRAPVALPQRIDGGLASVLERHAPVWINTQFNHPREVTPEAGAACMRLTGAGSPVSNQTVLLRGVNDDAVTMTRLCHGLQRIGVRPYYLFQCEPVRGADHFRTPLDVGIEIIGRMRGYTAGLCVPTFVLDIPHGGGKVPLEAGYLQSRDGSEVILRNYEGRIFKYTDTT